MFGFLGKKKGEEVSLADRIAAKPIHAEHENRTAAAKARVPFAGLGSAGAGDIKAITLS